MSCKTCPMIVEAAQFLKERMIGHQMSNVMHQFMVSNSLEREEGNPPWWVAMFETAQ